MGLFVHVSCEGTGGESTVADRGDGFIAFQGVCSRDL